MKQKYLILFSAVCLIFAACSKAPQESAEQTTQVRQEQAPQQFYTPQITFAQAIEQSDEQAVKYYLAQEESPNQVDDNGTPLIVLAAAQDNIKIFQALLAANAFIDTNI